MTSCAVVRPGAITQLWYYAILSQEQIAEGALASISQQFADVVNAAGAPSGACLFATIAEPPKAVFFSPASVSAVAQLIVLSRARPSPPPDRSRVELLVGNPQDWDLLPRSTH